jgi:hypothetical protein
MIVDCVYDISLHCKEQEIELCVITLSHGTLTVSRGSGSCYLQGLKYRLANTAQLTLSEFQIVKKKKIAQP